MRPPTASCQSRGRASKDQQQTGVGGVPDPLVGTTGNDSLVGIDLDCDAKRAAERHYRPDPRRESRPHHDDPEDLHRNWYP